MKRNDWKINIEELVASVSRKHGYRVARSAFEAYDATCFDDLNPMFYWDVYGNLQLMDEEYDEED